MFKTCRWGVNQTIHEWWYCSHCMHSKEEVLNEIDSDTCIFGLAFVDSFIGYQKKDRTRLNKEREEFMELIHQRHFKTST